MVPLEAAIPKMIILIACFLSCFTNGSIILATLSNKLLQSPCHYFIAFGALCDFSAQFVHYVDAFYTFSEITFVENYKCWLMIFIPFTMYANSYIITSIIGLDRLVAIAYPALYHSFRKFKYTTIVIVASLCYNIIWTLLALEAMLQNPLLKVKCGFGGFISSSKLSDIRKYVILTLCLVMAIVYALTWSFVRHRKSGLLNEKLLRPLTFIMIIIVFTYPVSFGAHLVATYLDAQTSAIVNNYSSVLTNIGIAINYFVYYAFCKDYRHEFQKQLAFLPWFKKLQRTNPVPKKNQTFKQSAIQVKTISHMNINI